MTQRLLIHIEIFLILLQRLFIYISRNLIGRNIETINFHRDFLTVMHRLYIYFSNLDSETIHTYRGLHHCNTETTYSYREFLHPTAKTIYL